MKFAILLVPIKNSKFEARNPKQARMLKTKKYRTNISILSKFSNFKFRICFEFRHSDFVLRVWRAIIYLCGQYADASPSCSFFLVRFFSLSFFLIGTRTVKFPLAPTASKINRK